MCEFWINGEQINRVQNVCGRGVDPGVPQPRGPWATLLEQATHGGVFQPL